MELDERLRILLKQTETNDKEKIRFYHINSIKNISRSLINDKKSKRLSNVSTIRKKELLAEYLEIININDISNESKFYYDNYVSKLGRFMNSYYGFCYCGGKMLILFLFSFLLTGIIIDVLTFAILGDFFSIYLITLILGITRALIKYKHKKVYGPNY